MPSLVSTRDDATIARFLADVGRVLSESLDMETTLRRVASLTVPAIADWCSIELLVDGALVELALVHQDPAKQAIVRELRQRYPSDATSDRGSWPVVRSGRPTLISEVTEELIESAAVDSHHAALIRELDLRSYLCLPLRSSGRVLGALTLATDGSGRRLDEDDLRLADDLAARAARAIENAQAFRTADRFRRILDAIGEAVFIIDQQDGRIRDVNRGALELVGLGRDDLIGRPLWSYAAGVDPAVVRDLVESSGDGGTDPTSVGIELRRRDGGAIPVELQFQRVDLPGEPGGLVAIVRDIRERMDARARLERLARAEHARAAELNAVIRAMGDGVVVCDSQGRITMANPAARALFPHVEERSYGDILAELHDPDGQAPELGRHGGPLVLGSRRDDRWIEITTYAVADGEPALGERRETIVVLRDVTAAREREAVRETFIGVLSHELRTPVTTIYGGAKLLARPDSMLEDSTRREIFDDIVAEAERLQRLVEDVVALNRFGDGGGDLGQEPVLLQRLVPAVIRSEEGRWPGIEFVVDIPPGLPTVVADPTYMEQVVRNLISNAAKYGGGQARIEVVVEAADDEVAVRILDEGPGIEPGEADRLFELFYRSPATAGSASGAGIGLFVCARLVRAMGGRIWGLPRPAGGAEFGFALRVMNED